MVACSLLTSWTNEYLDDELMKTHMKIVNVALALICVSHIGVLAQDDGSLFGTTSVSFAPIQVSGTSVGVR